MKICFLTHNLKQDNGGGVLSRRFIEGLRDTLDCEIVALTTHFAGMPYEKAILHPQQFKLIKEFFNIRKIIKSCDVVHAFDVFPYGLVAFLTSLGLRKKFIITAVGSGSIIPLHRLLYSWLIKIVYHRADRIVAISRFTKAEILRQVNDLAIEVINLGVDLKEIEKAKNEPVSQKILNYRPYLLSVGSLRWRKGYHFMIESFVKINKKFPDLKYLLVGKKCDSVYYERLKKMIKDLNLEERIFILDNIEERNELYHLYQNAELFCLLPQNVNYDVEGFGIVFVEAAANGLPVVGKRNCGAEDAVKEGKNGFLVNARNDPEEFADAIITILKDENLKKAMSNASLAFAENFDWNDKIREYLGIYKDLPN